MLRTLTLSLPVLATACSPAANFSAPADVPKSPRSFATGHYRNAFHELGESDAAIKAKLEGAWRQLFYGKNDTERVYFPVGADEAYIKDVGNDDVRTEGMSYGMMIAVQTGHQDEFDRLWRWADRHMLYKDGPYQGLFAWQCDDRGNIRGRTPASDGEEYFATALLFAAGRWPKAAIDYRAAADSILHAMVHPQPGTPAMFDPVRKQVVFVPNGDAAKFTDPSYHLPAFYELWARFGPREDRAFWSAAVDASRTFLKAASNPTTGLYSDYATFAGAPTKAPWDPQGTGDRFGSDAFRVGGNLAMDWLWFGKDPSEVDGLRRMLSWLAAQKPSYVSGYTVDGKPTVAYQSGGHVAMNAVAAIAAEAPESRRFVQALWDAPIPSGRWRYYDGMLYLFGLLHASGRYRVWAPAKF